MGRSRNIAIGTAPVYQKCPRIENRAELRVQFGGRLVFLNVDRKLKMLRELQ